jgi:hypothetical protein
MVEALHSSKRAGKRNKSAGRQVEPPINFIIAAVSTRTPGKRWFEKH